MPALVVGLLLNTQKKSDKLYKKYLILNLGIGLFTTLVMSLVKRGSGYSSYFETNFQSMIGTLVNYIALLNSYGFKYVILLPIVYFSYQTTIKRKFLKSILLAFILTISALLIQLPWPVPLGRYLLPLSVPLGFILAISIEGMLRKNSIPRLKIPVRILVFFALFSLSFYSSLVMVSFASDYYVREKTNQKFIIQLATILEPDSRLFINLTNELNAWEWFDEVKVHLDLFYQKTPQTLYANLLQEKDYQLKKEDVLVSWNQFQDLSDIDIAKLTSGLVSQKISGIYYRPSGGIKTLTSDLLKNPKDFLSFNSQYWQIKEYQWIIFKNL